MVISNFAVELPHVWIRSHNIEMRSYHWPRPTRSNQESLLVFVFHYIKCIVYVIMSALTSNVLPVFLPPEGGDLVLRSSDGVEFRVHSLFMGVASSVFSDMLTIGTKSEFAVQLDEDAETISLILQNVYPTKSPTIHTFRLLEKGLNAARKYDLQRLKDNLEEQLCSGLHDPLVRQDPLRACVLCDTYGLSRARDVAARAVDCTVDLRNPKGLLNLRKWLPESALAIRLLGTQVVKTSIMVEVLFCFHDEPMRTPWPLACQSCMPRQWSSGYKNQVVPWQPKWSLEVYRRALKIDLKDAATQLNFITQTPLKELLGGTDIACISCRDLLVQDDNYKIWAASVKNTLVSRLSSRGVNSLY